MPAHTSRSRTKEQRKQERIDARYARLDAALDNPDADKLEKLPGLSRPQTELFWYGFGRGLDHLARHLHVSIRDLLGDAADLLPTAN
jgi:hypothetical protein